ncbi:UNVERIFIED_CONTAM: hypothetical protein RMT77_004080 [Armadillidium vulgare]
MFKLTISCLLVSYVAALPDGYPSTRPSSTAPPSYYPPTTPKTCEDGLVLDPYGECVEPEVIRDLYVFQEPTEQPNTERPELPAPKVKLNLLVIKTNEEEPAEPIIIPPPQEKTLVLVLSEKGSNQRQIIEVPAPEGEKPEVFFVDYAKDENPLLPGNIYLKDALSYAEGSQGSSSGSTSNQTYSTGGDSYAGTDDAVDTEVPEETEPYSPYYF